MQLAFCTVFSCHLSEWDNNFGTVALHCTGAVLTCSVYLFLKQCVTSSPYDTGGKKSTNIRMYMYNKDSSSYTYNIDLVLYSGELSREKTLTNWWKVYFCRENFHRLLTLPCQRMPHPQILRRRLSQIATKLQNLQKFSPSKVSCYTVIGKDIKWSNTYSGYRNVLVLVHVPQAWSKPLITDRANSVFFHCVVKCRRSGTSCNFSEAIVVEENAVSILQGTLILYSTATYMYMYTIAIKYVLH